MRAWSAAPVPDLPGAAERPVVHDSSMRDRLALDSDDPALLYVCGITPYDATHLGHASTYLAFDLLVRLWRDGGRAVRYVQNVTDIDDPLFERANATGEDWAALAERETELFRTDMSALRILPPDAYVGAIESVQLIIDLVSRLDERGAVYDIEGDRYFSVRAAEDFGVVSGLDTTEMTALLAERGGDPDRVGKRDPLDCLLWIGERTGEPSWPSPWGRGRPGWHVECTAIALHHLGETLDVQAGGRDLVFPHHEMCAAEARVATGAPFARAYLHQGMVGLDGEKMSKSKGNLVLVSRLRADGVDPMAIRLALLAHHYRGDWIWTPSDLDGAEERLARWRLAVRDGSRAHPDHHAPDARQLLADLRASLVDDLDAPSALQAVDDWAAHRLAANGTPGAAAAVAQACDALLGVDLLTAHPPATPLLR